MNKIKKLNQIRERRKKRTRLKIRTIAKQVNKPRFSIFKSNRYIYIQLIDDIAGKTLASVSMADSKKAAAESGKAIAEKAIAKGIKKAVFDRGGYKYHGQIKAIAEAIRKAGLEI